MSNSETDVRFECVDFAERRVRFTEDVARHVSRRHPEVDPFLKFICDALSNPNLVYFRERTRSHLFYKLGVMSGKLAGTYMVVVVWYDDAQRGTVKTIYATTRPAAGDELIHVGGR